MATNNDDTRYLVFCIHPHRQCGAGVRCPWNKSLCHEDNWNKVFVSGQAIREASLTVLRPTAHGSERAERKNIFYADSPQAAGC